MIDDINTVHPFQGVFGSIKIREIIAELVKIVPIPGPERNIAFSQNRICENIRIMFERY